MRKSTEFEAHGDVPANAVTDVRVDTFSQVPKKSKQTAFSKHRKALLEIKGRNPPAATSLLQGAHGANTPRPFTYTADDGEYLSLHDLNVSLFLERTSNGTHKRPGPDDDEDQENRPAKHKRLEAKRMEAKHLRVLQQREVEELQRTLDEKKRKLELLVDAELGLADQMGQVMKGMTDEDYEALQL